jgi:hypothetical protein
MPAPDQRPRVISVRRVGEGSQDRARSVETKQALGSETEPKRAATVFGGDTLFAQAEALQQFVVSAEVVLLQVIEELATAAREGEKAPAGVEVLAVNPEVLGEVIDAAREERHLHFARSGVLIVDLVLRDDLLLVNDF